MSELSQPPFNDDEIGEVIPFPDRKPDDNPTEMSDEQLQLLLAELRGGKRIENYFRTSDGHQQMNQLINRLDDTTDITMTVGKMLDAKTLEQKKNWFVKVLLSPEGVEGLNHPSLAQAFRQNPAMERTLGFIRRAQHDGLTDTEQLYRSLITLLANITRYEVVNDAYDPEGDKWTVWAAKTLYHRGDPKNAVYYHPEWPKPTS
jgi:hypothetical protein